MAKKLVLPWELKADHRLRSYTSMLKAWLYVVREEYGAKTALKLYDRVCKIDDRVKRLTNSLLAIFKLEGNDAATIAKWWDIYWQLTGIEATILEDTKTISRVKITKCPFKTEPKDISEWCETIFVNTVVKTINPKATVEQTENMCAGDPYCEFVIKIEE